MKFDTKFFAKTEYLFLIIAILVGFFLVFSVPPFYGENEPTNFARVYQMSEGGFLPEVSSGVRGGRLPVSLSVPSRYINERLDKSALTIPINSTNRQFIAISDAAPPTAYLPQTLGVLVGRLLKLNLLRLLWIARILGLFTYIIVVFHAIKTTPIFKNLIFFLALLPVNLYHACVLSHDTMITSAALLLLALVLRAIFGHGGPSQKRVTQLAALSAIIVTIRPSCLPLILVCFLIPPRKFGGTKRYLSAMAIILIVSLGLAGLWSALIRGASAPLQAGASISEQLSFILHHPKQYLITLFSTLMRNRDVLLHESAGRIFGSPFPVYIPRWIAPILLIIAVIIAFLDNPSGFRMGLPQRLLFPILGAVGVMTVAGALYLTHTVVGGGTIEGLQGRYFAPYLIFFAVAFASTVKAQPKGTKVFATTSASLALIILCTQVFQAYH